MELLDPAILLTAASTVALAWLTRSNWQVWRRLREALGAGPKPDYKLRFLAAGVDLARAVFAGSFATLIVAVASLVMRLFGFALFPPGVGLVLITFALFVVSVANRRLNRLLR